MSQFINEQIKKVIYLAAPVVQIVASHNTGQHIFTTFLIRD